MGLRNTVLNHFDLHAFVQDVIDSLMFKDYFQVKDDDRSVYQTVVKTWVEVIKGHWPYVNKKSPMGTYTNEKENKGLYLAG